MHELDVLDNPGDKVVLEHSLDHLMQQIWCDETVDLSTRKFFCEGLDIIVV